MYHSRSPGTAPLQKIRGPAISTCSGRVALVTGASQGIGRAVALALASSGAKVWLAARNETSLASVADEVTAAGGEAQTVLLDVSAGDGIKDALAPVLDAGGVDILVNNAGITDDGLFPRMNFEGWDKVLETNLTGSVRVTQALLRPMLKKRWGRIIFMSSVVAQAGSGGQVSYAAAKAGQLGVTRSLAREVASRNITVNAIAPGYIATNMTDSLSEEQQKGILSGVPAGRMGTGEDVAAGVLYLASEGAGYVTGQVLNINGGMYM